MKSLSLSILSAGVLLSAGCTVDFDPYNEGAEIDAQTVKLFFVCKVSG